MSFKDPFVMATTEEDDSLKESSLFPFIDLPPLIQWKFLRQYVPFSDKVTILTNMEEFSGLCDRDSPCWLGGFDAFFDLLPILSALTPGLYVRWNAELPYCGYYVSMDRENIIEFTLCMLIPPDDCYREDYFSNEAHERPCRLTVLKPINSVKKVLKYFLRNHVLADCRPLQAYVGNRYAFLINTSEKTILSDFGKCYSIEPSGYCKIKRRNSKERRFSYLHVNFDNFSVQVTHRGRVDQLLKKPLKYLMVDKETNQIRNVMSRYILEISKHNTIKITMETYNVFDFCKNTMFDHFSYWLRV